MVVQWSISSNTNGEHIEREPLSPAEFSMYDGRVSSNIEQGSKLSTENMQLVHGEYGAPL